MSLKTIFYLLLVASCFSACSNQETYTVWVSGLQVKCNAGVGDFDCIQIHRGEDLQNAKWKKVYGNIRGFEFEKGFYKKILLNEEQLDPETLPQDVSSIAYTMVKQLDEKVDTRGWLAGEWKLNQVNQELIPQDVPTPTLEINLEEMSLSGSGGCNGYSADIINVTDSQLEFTSVVSSTRACKARNIEPLYLENLYKAENYKVDENRLFFYDKKGEQVLSFLKTKKGESKKERLHDIWIVRSWMGTPIDKDKHAPLIEINLTRMDIRVSNSCQEYVGRLEFISNTSLETGVMVLLNEEEGCVYDMNKMIASFSAIYTYELNELELKLIDKAGKEIFILQKVD